MIAASMHSRKEIRTLTAPLGWEHITFNGDYIWPAEPIKNGFRPLRDTHSPFREAA